MILSKEFYDKCCPTYQKAIDELEKKLADNGLISYQYINDEASRRFANSTKENVKIRYEASRREFEADLHMKMKKLCDTILDFAEKYLTPKEYWEYAMHYFDRIISDFALEDIQKFYRGFAKTSFFQHLYYNHAWNSINCTRVYDGREHFFNAYGSKRLKLIEFQMKHYLQQLYHQTYDVTELDLQYPHDRLKECFRQYERNAIKGPSDDVVKQYEKMTALFAKINAAEGNVEEWFKLLAEAGDDIFVMDNVERRLGHDLFNVKLWKLYLTFLKENGHCNKLVKTYSKYCRFFLEDYDMLEVYKAELAKHGKADVPLDEICIIDVKEDVEDEEKEDVTQDDEIVPFDKSICSSFYDSARNQKFSLREPLIEYMLENAGHRVLRKLFESCKYFYDTRSTPICYRLENGPETTFNGESLTLNPAAEPEFFLKKAVISGIINIVDMDSLDLFFMSSLIPHLHRCEAKYITLCHQFLTYDELKCLIQHGGVVELQVGTCVIKDERDDFVDLEQILAYLPNFESLGLPRVKTNENTGTALTKFKFNGKIHFFRIDSIVGERFSAEDFVKFCKANRDEKMFKCYMSFVSGFNLAFVQKLKWMMEDFAESFGNCTVAICLEGDVVLL